MQSARHKLLTPIEYLKGVGPQRAELLKKELNVFTFSDLLTHYPFRYFDRSRFYKISEIQSDAMFIQFKGVLVSSQLIGSGRVKRLVAVLRDETGSMELVWFQGITWIEKMLKTGTEYTVFGKPTNYKGKLNFTHPEIEPSALVDPEREAFFQPVYSSTEKLKTRGLESKGLSKLMRQLFTEISSADLPEIMPASVINEFKMMDRFEAMRNIHFPANEQMMNKAAARLKFEELLITQLRILSLKVGRNESVQGLLFPNIGSYFNDFYHKHLSFKLTEAQQRVLKEIRRDTLSGKQMNRLLQGDVGSGKTVVALITCLMALDNNYQSCVMAPTEILAQQHYETFSLMLGEMPLKVALLTGSVKGVARRKILEELVNGEIHILIGTHALIEDVVRFKNLGMVVIDEQHRFGVSQRAKLWEKNQQWPHVLVMTATPIPRTLAMTVYGDLDVSVIDQLPPGRKPVNTQHKFDSQRLAVFGFMKQQIAEGRQVYVVYPLIEESEKMDYKDLMDGYESISREFPLPQYKVGILHGRMKPADKEFEMARFQRGETQIMVATTVIEVGVNVPNASVMIIESAERFGLSQLHQLRGRVGRGASQSYCILMSGNKLSHESRQRLKIMCETNDGFEIAEFDLKMRGPGDIEGTQQSGLASLKLADISRDRQLLQLARDTANRLLDEDPHLSSSANTALKQHLDHLRKGTTEWSRIS